MRRLAPPFARFWWRWSAVLLALFCPLAVSAAPEEAAAAPVLPLDLFHGLVGDWRAPWREQHFWGPRTVFTVEPRAGQPALRAFANRASSSLVCPLPEGLPPGWRLQWQWQIAAPLGGHAPERTKDADDFVARVFVVFEQGWLPTQTRALNYVWARTEPVGATWRSPYTNEVVMLVQRSAEAAPLVWLSETVDPIADYTRAFGHPPRRLSGVAVMSDTDNTRQSATAWFRALYLLPPPPSAADTPGAGPARAAP